MGSHENAAMHHNHRYLYNDRASSATRKLAKFSSRPSSTSSSSLYYCFCLIFSLLLFNRSKVKSLHSAAQTVDKKSTFKKMKKELRARRTCPGVQPNWRRSPSARNNTKCQTRGNNASSEARGKKSTSSPLFIRWLHILWFDTVCSPAQELRVCPFCVWRTKFTYTKPANARCGARCCNILQLNRTLIKRVVYALSEGERARTCPAGEDIRRTGGDRDFSFMIFD